MGIREGLMLADYLRNGETRAEQEVATAKLTMARAKGLEADAALKRQHIEQTLAHQQRLLQALMRQGAPQASTPPAPAGNKREE